jgi:peptidase M20/M25/M40-like protein
MPIRKPRSNCAQRPRRSCGNAASGCRSYRRRSAGRERADDREPLTCTRSKAPSSVSPRFMAAAPGALFPKPCCCVGQPVRSSQWVRAQIERAIRRIADGACRACGAEMELPYERRYPSTVNAAPETEIAATTAASLVHESEVRRDLLPSMGAEDFDYSLQRKPGAYIWIGNGSAERGGMPHNPHYDFTPYCHPVRAIGRASPNRCSRRNASSRR